MVEHILDRRPGVGAKPIDKPSSWLQVELNASHPGTILSTVMLFFHQQIELLNTILPAAILLLVKTQRLEQPYECYSTFMLNLVAHGLQ